MNCCKVLRRDGDKEDSFKEEYYRIGIFGGDRVGKNSLICRMINHFILDDYTCILANALSGGIILL